VKKAEAEKAVRQMCHEWAKQRGLSRADYPSANFIDFWFWAQAKYLIYLKFQTATGVKHDVEMWFGDEMGQRGFN
jgi:hypothetical protein